MEYYGSPFHTNFPKMKRLRDYAKSKGIGYRAAWNRFKKGLIPGAFKDESGLVLIPEENDAKLEYTVIYARVSSSDHAKNLESQAKRLSDYCAAKGYQVKQIVKDCASGLNDKRPKLIKLLKDDRVTRIVVEHHDRLTRFGFNYLNEWMKYKGCQIEVINEAVNDKEDLMKDFISLVTSLTARLYGLRRSKRKTEQLIKGLTDEKEKK